MELCATDKIVSKLKNENNFGVDNSSSNSILLDLEDNSSRDEGSFHEGEKDILNNSKIEADAKEQMHSSDENNINENENDNIDNIALQ